MHLPCSSPLAATDTNEVTNKPLLNLPDFQLPIDETAIANKFGASRKAFSPEDSFW